MSNMIQATFGGGCFWCVEAVVQRLKGVHKVESGYSGGSSSDADYKKVCSGGTDHVEVVQVTFEPDVISYYDLLVVFLTSHDPTQVNRQGADVGTQYRSVIFYHDPEQQATAEQVIADLQPRFGTPIATRVEPLDVFYPAEGYHQNYYANNPQNRYCSMVIEPKLSKLRAAYQDKLK
ncbi:peptide-methionine (S)-S-oxide reductase MsrA [Pseudoalteromonas sp. ACER1]|uniref:Peptide methionine sulfoxide reductase MsrA n=2 Tax=Pseudomonadota TaxID=1224 RepID=A0AB36FM22_ALTMA|nr:MULTISPECIES: peptide-methionine (S)-S-oxide reductase MsrA [Alteromonadales]MCF2848327.1 peptide-methionine (S)-S-oxide reductase MsrA [Pseudoalteromonas sp. PAST1]MCG7639667.1 peptide-methionine (S)-S-oxide reductase MsrA [Alteromonas sp. CNT1-28]MCG7651541.1 peptide-methionine (S)-S-oxide reductase MsrA [Alteromonas sp. MmMcT2-5]MCO7209070.1 peptide-methionine (S)-S-oxide reductase MsrA [Pseudoalteromonas sp. CnMc7-37]MCO7212110.1 peptide-methionine (S)-S-oxide reductase MsrA [Pseudoalte